MWQVVVIAREHSGYPVLGQFFTPQRGFFVHGAVTPGMEREEDVVSSAAHYLHTIYTLSAHYLHTFYTLSTHYLHTIYPGEPA